MFIHKIILWERVIESMCVGFKVHTFRLPEFFMTAWDSSLSTPVINVFLTPLTILPY